MRYGVSLVLDAEDADVIDVLWEAGSWDGGGGEVSGL